MRRLSPLFSCLLLALWFAANQHCTLEACTLSGDGDESDRCACCQGAVGDDDCGKLESGQFKPANDTLKLPPPDLLVCVCYLCAPVTPAVPREISARGESNFVRPQEWVAGWSFDRHAAPLPGAPSGLVA